MYAASAKGLQQISSSTGGKLLDKMNDSEKGSLEPEALEWPWKLSTSSYFCYHMGTSEEINTFENMIAAARAASAMQVLQVYAHTLADSAKPNQSSRRQVIPYARKAADIVMQLPKLPDTEWGVNTLANFLNDDSVAPVDTAMLLPAFRVKLKEGVRFHTSGYLHDLRACSYGGLVSVLVNCKIPCAPVCCASRVHVEDCRFLD